MSVEVKGRRKRADYAAAERNHLLRPVAPPMQDDELVTAEPCDHIRFAQALPKALRGGHQQGVARRVAE
jgi:hypothetical protein